MPSFRLGFWDFRSAGSSLAGSVFNKCSDESDSVSDDLEPDPEEY